MPLDAERPNFVIKDWIANGGAQGWEHKELAADLYNAEEIMRFYFFQPRNDGDYVMPQATIGFEKTHVNSLAFYSLVPDSKGLSFGITFNSVHLDRPKWSLYETLAHEMVHVLVENNPALDKPVKGHGKAFTAWAEDIGLHPLPGYGAHWKIADGQFERLMERWGIEKPAEADRVVPKDTPKDNWWDVGPKPKGVSTLTLYEAEGCSTKPVCKIRSGRKDLDIACLTCSGYFRPVYKT